MNDVLQENGSDNRLIFHNYEIEPFYPQATIYKAISVTVIPAVNTQTNIYAIIDERSSLLFKK